MNLILSLFVLLQPIKETNPFKIVINAGITLHQKIISPVQGDVCNFSPSCSRFGKKAVEKYGVFWGSLMAADRLMRCNFWSVEHVDMYYSGIRHQKICDPVENNYIFGEIKKTKSSEVQQFLLLRQDGAQ